MNNKNTKSIKIKENKLKSKKKIELCYFKNPYLNKDKIEIFIYDNKKNIMNKYK
jgi:hypothetical protein